MLVRKQTFEFDEYEIEKLLNVTTDYDHQVVKRDLGTNTIINANVNYYRKKDNYNEKLSIEEVTQKLFSLLKEQGHIKDDIKKFNYKINARHSWSGYDDDGYAHSIYSHDLIISINNERINLNKPKEVTQ